MSLLYFTNHEPTKQRLLLCLTFSWDFSKAKEWEVEKKEVSHTGATSEALQLKKQKDCWGDGVGTVARLMIKKIAL